MVYDWENDRILHWLNLGHFSPAVLDAFRSHKITGITLPMLSTMELKEMGIEPLRVRLQIMSAISQLLLENDVAPIDVNHPLVNEIQSLAVTNELLSSIDNYHEISSIKLQMDKLKDEFIHIMKEKKPLPPPHPQQHHKKLQQVQPPVASSDTLKQLRAKNEDPCYKILQSAMKSHGLNKSEWKKFVLVICYGGDKERVLGYEEKPVQVFKELHDLGLNPNMMLRQVDNNGGKSGATPGGRL